MTDKQKPITPACCAAAQERPALRLSYSSEAIYEAPEGQEAVQPLWQVKAYDPTYERDFAVPANFCPYCGTPAPEIKRRKTGNRKICQVTDGGYYCDTCSQRLMCCTCWPPEYAWEPVK